VAFCVAFESLIFDKWHHQLTVSVLGQTVLSVSKSQQFLNCGVCVCVCERNDEKCSTVVMTINVNEKCSSGTVFFATTVIIKFFIL
jgi:hypothetical protein